MKTRSLLERLDDWLNPIVVKELRQAVRSRMVMSALLFLLLLQLITLTVALMFNEERTVSGQQINFYAGRNIFLVLQGLLLGTCLLLIPAFASVRLASERSETNVDLLFISTLRPYNIIAGKMGVSIVMSLLVFSACAPFMTFTYLMRGIDIPTIFIVLLFDLLVVLTGTQLAIFQASIPASRGFRAILGLTCVGILIGGLIWSITLSYVMVVSGVGLLLDSWLFWGPALTLLVLLLSAMALFFSWSVGMISPPSANRALSGRVCLAGVWLATAGLTALWCVKTRSVEAIYFWQLILLLFGLQMGISINERESWGPRIRRMIPRRVWLRPLAFLFYSGSAGGMLFAALFMGLTLGGLQLGYTLQDRGYLTTFFHREGSDLLLMGALGCLYLYCYCLTSVLFVRLLFGGRMNGQTWVFMVVLLALGIMLPYLLRFLYLQGAPAAQDDLSWLLLPNPFYSIGQSLSERHARLGASDPSHETLTWIFLAVWASAASLLAMPWFVRQVSRFKPSEPSAVVMVE